MEMAKLSEAQAKMLRLIADAGPEGLIVTGGGRTLAALRRQYLVAEAHGDADRPMCWRIGPSGRTALDEHERAEQAEQEQAERASRPVPASAFVEPSARTAPVLGLEYDEEPDEVVAEIPANRADLIGVAKDAQRGIRPALDMIRTVAERAGYAMTAGGWVREVASVDNPEHHGRVAHGWREFAGCVLDVERFRTQDVIVKALGLDEIRQDSGPSVRLTPAPAGVEREATDAEILQLLAMLDAGVKVSRSLYQEYIVTGVGSWTLNLDAVNRAARDAVRFGLATQEFRERLYRLSAEPIHYAPVFGAALPETKCGHYVGPQAKIRARITTDPAKVTHERCK